MTAFILVVCFPIVVATGFGVIHGSMRWLGVNRESTARTVDQDLVIYLLLLTLPLMASLREMAATDTGQPGMQLPELRNVVPVLPAVLGIPLAVVLGVGLYCAELVLAATLQQTVAKDRAGRRSALEGVARHLRFPRRAHVYMGLSVLVAIAEEFVWRGFLIAFLVNRLEIPAMGAIIGAGGLFGINHAALGLQSVVAKTVDGIVWGGLAVMSGSLWPPLVSHVTFQYMVCRRLQRWSSR